MSDISNDILGDISPDRKRQIARAWVENGAKHKKQERGGMQERPKLMDAVHILAANLNRLIEWHKDRRTLFPTSNQAIAKKAGMSSHTVGRMRRGDGSVGIGNLSKVAKVFKLHPNQLLSPGLDPGAPAEVVSEQDEIRLLMAFRAKGDPSPKPVSH